MEDNQIPYKVKMQFDYQKVNDLWEKIKIPYISRKEAEQGMRKLIIKFGKSHFAPPSWVSEDGKQVIKRKNLNPRRFRVLKSFICLSGNPQTLHRGWRDLIHTCSHWVYNYRKGYKNHFGHSQEQAKLEYDMSKYVISSGWLEGGLKPKIVILSKDEKRLKTIKHLQNLIERWQRKQKIANTFIRKYHKKLKYHTKK